MRKKCILYRAKLDGARPCEASDIRDARMSKIFTVTNLIYAGGENNANI